MLESLSIVTITYNNPEDLINTYNSLESFRKAGGQHIIVNGGTTIKQIIGDDCVLLEEPDRGIYDALNKVVNDAAKQVMEETPATEEVTIEDKKVEGEVETSA